MSSELLNAMSISAAGMQTQGVRVRVLSQNIANSTTTGQEPGSDPYRRKTISFENVLDKELGVHTVRVATIGEDKTTPFKTKFMPEHPAADEKGVVKMPNINSLIEMMDVREAQRAYQANLGLIEQSKAMANRTIDLLRTQ